MRKAIISMTTYDWVKYCAGLVLTDTSINYDIIIVRRDHDRPIYKLPSLCYDAVYAQRKHDINRICKKLGVRKVLNLGYGNVINSKRLATQITLHTSLNNIKEIYYEPNDILQSICQAQSSVISYKYGALRDSEYKKVLILSPDVLEKKKDIADVMIGISDIEEGCLNEPIERFY